VLSYSTPPQEGKPEPTKSSFSGQLIAVNRRGNSIGPGFTLRQVVEGVGVEIKYNLFSPLLASITVAGSDRPTDWDGKVIKVRTERKAKAWFVRKQPERMINVMGIVKAHQKRVRDKPEEVKKVVKKVQDKNKKKKK
jgi:large subunit ribosomal protein L19